MEQLGPGIAGAGEVIRDSMGNWIVGFAAHLGLCSNVAAELHALRLGGRAFVLLFVKSMRRLYLIYSFRITLTFIRWERC